MVAASCGAIDDHLPFILDYCASQKSLCRHWSGTASACEFVNWIKSPCLFLLCMRSGDTLVPYQQAVNLCGATEGSVLPVDVVDPLTVYSCGAASQVQIVKDAENTLELGICVGLRQ